ncbi:lipopolysaccharide heptosyltransferase family protein [Hwanghaeella grinnelliae]|uniref:Lipopolysaccharide heptosyltransferase family protein n=2 Tax=Hwanghaeella grinnelliae TaxID=2500179 RepID=A0A437QQV6_9PROT|nr:lipopolysaccharide heptosyltransferase family protein [Hwanghaeella grinnelliae]
MQAIRKAYPMAEISLLTTVPFRKLAEASGLFDAILIDPRPALWNLPGVLRLRTMLCAARPQIVFDLQTSDRSSTYLKLFWPNRPLWSGIAAGASHPHANTDRDAMHTVDRQREQLAGAGILDVALPDLSFLGDEGIDGMTLPDRFVLLAPGGAPHRPEKRWPAENFADLAARLQAAGLTPVVLGTKAEAEAEGAILRRCPDAMSLIGKTSLLQIAPLARRAAGAVGNDTGPMHLITISGCPSVVLYSHASDPALCAQKGPSVTILRQPDLNALPPDQVFAALKPR